MTKIGFYAKAAIVLIVALLAVNSANAQDKDKRVTFESPTMLISDMMSDIERQTSFRFAFDKNVFDTSRKVTLSKLEMSLDEALKQMVVGQKVDYTIHNQYVAIFFKEEKKPEPVRKKTELPPPPVIPNYTSFNISAPESYFKTGLPSFNVKTDLLYTLASSTINIGGEMGFGDKTSLELTAGAGFWNKVNSTGNKNTSFIIRPEFRYWLCERFNGHFFGVNAVYEHGRYNFTTFKNEYDYMGNSWGMGITYGYHYMLGARWGVELALGAGFSIASYDVNKNGNNSEEWDKFYFGLTRASISLVYIIK